MMAEGEQLNRECGICTLCCKLLEVKELKKPQGVWCLQCEVGQGCAIHADRPASCRVFDCLWLQGLGSDELRPDKTKVVMAAAGRGELLLHVDPSQPDAFREPMISAMIDKLICEGVRVFVVRGKDRVAIESTSRPPTENGK